MGICHDPDKDLAKGIKIARRKKKRYTGRNAGHRYRGDPKMVIKDTDWFTESGAVGGFMPADPRPVEISNETNEMWDTHGYIQRVDNPCAKEKFHIGDVTISPVVDFAGKAVCDFNTTSPSPRSTIRANIPWLDDAQIDELALQSEQALSNVVDTQASLANFLIELAETCMGNVRGIRRFQSIYERALAAYKKAYKNLLRQGHKEASARWLAWNFAIKPALKDLKAIMCSIDTAYRKMAWLKAHNHKVVSLHYVRDGIEKLINWDQSEWHEGVHFVSVNTPDFPSPLISTNGAYVHRCRYTDLKVFYRATSLIKLDIPDKYLEGMYGMSTLWAALMGLHNPIGIIWEAIPFSWLIDYFLSYRARLFETVYDYNPYNAGVTVLGYCHSFHIEAVGDVDVYNTTHHYTHDSLGRYTYDLYIRVAGLPQPETTTLFRLPDTWYKASILASIVVGSHRH